MPHVILEYSSNIAAKINGKKVLEAIHRRVIDSGLFNAADVKSRAYMTDHYLVGEHGHAGSFAHVRVYIMQGRTTEQKLTLSEPLFAMLREALPQDTSVTVDIRDLDKECYKKVVLAA